MATRYQPQPGDTEAADIDGDAGFVGVNARLSPEQLPPGYVAAATNIEFRDGQAVTRRGLAMPSWLDLVTPLCVPPVSGSAVVKSPETNAEGIIIAKASGIYFCETNTPKVSIPIPVEEITGTVRFSSAFGRVYAWREGLAPWVWEGASGFTVLDSTDLDNGTRPVPFAGRAETMNDRILVRANNSEVDISDIGEPGQYGILNRVRFDVGRGDVIARVFPFTNDAALVFKTLSIHLLSGISGTLASLSVNVVNAELGCIAPDSVASTGGDVLFLSQTGVFRVRQIVQDRIETAPVAVSYDIEPLLRQRVNWSRARYAQGAVFGERYLLAIAIDGSTTNNAIFVFNLVTEAWEGIHTFGISIDALLETELYGDRRLFAVDYVTGYGYVLYEGEEDIIKVSGESTPTPIATSLTTRGYLAASGTRKRFSLAQVATSEWHGAWGASMSVDGNEETEPLYPAAITRSTTARTIAGAAAWTPTNANDDHGAKGREDYAFTLPMQIGTGVQPDRRQDFTERFIAQETGRFCQLTITATRGVVAVRGVQVECAPQDRAYLPTS